MERSERRVRQNRTALLFVVLSHTDVNALVCPPVATGLKPTSSNIIASRKLVVPRKRVVYQSDADRRSPLFLHRKPLQKEEPNHDHTANSSRNMRSTTGLFSNLQQRDSDREKGAVNTETLERLQRDNERLRERLENLEEENQMLHYEVASRVVLETFEGEGKMRRFLEQRQKLQREAETTNHTGDSLTRSAEEIMSDYESQLQGPSIWCDQLNDDDSCSVEPLVSFGEAFRDRAVWLVGLLVLQSCSGLILARNEALLGDHPIIVYFLTMLVGAGGNAGNQASVRVIRGLALGTLNEKTQTQFLIREFKMAGALSAILSFAGFIRAAVFRTPFPETVAVTAALGLIVFSSVCLGAILPLIMKRLRVDPAHSSTTIQVIMDILGVLLAVVVASTLLDSPLGSFIMSRLGG